MCYSLSNHSSINGYLGCFLSFLTRKNAAVKMGFKIIHWSGLSTFNHFYSFSYNIFMISTSWPILIFYSLHVNNPYLLDFIYFSCQWYALVFHNLYKFLFHIAAGIFFLLLYTQVHVCPWLCIFNLTL